MDSSVYCLPADLLGEGADRVVGTVRDRAGVSGVTVAACYHASRDILPHNPAYRVGHHRTQHPHRVESRTRITRPANHEPLTFAAGTPPEPLPPSRDWGLWHITPARWG